MSALPKPHIQVYTCSVMTTFGERFKLYRESKGLPVHTLAALAAIPAAHIYEVERGDRKGSDAFLEKIASVKEMDITYDQLKAWQIMSKATPEQLAYIGREIKRIKATHDQETRTE